MMLKIVILFATCLSLCSTISADSSEDDSNQKLNELVNEMPILTYRTLSLVEMLRGSENSEEAGRPLTKEEIVAKALYSFCDISKFTSKAANKAQSFDNLLAERLSEPCKVIATASGRTTSYESQVSYTNRVATIRRLSGFCMQQVSGEVNRDKVFEHFMDLVEDN